MQKKLFIALSLTLVCYWAESSPVGLGTLEFDNLETDLDDLNYEVAEEDLDAFSKLLDNAAYGESVKSDSAPAKPKTKVKSSGFNKKKTANQGLKSNHNIEDLKKFFKTAGVHDQGAYDDDEVYALAEGVAATAVGFKGNEDRKYRKGIKTRGFHRVQHKDEYKKDQMFYEDDITNGTIKKVGAKGLGFRVGAGAGFNKGHFHHDRQKGIFGKQGYSDRGSLDKNFKGFSDAQGFDATFISDS